MDWRESWNMESVPDEVFWKELGRRRNAIGGGGRPKTHHTCPYCGQQFSAREIRKHKPRCPKGANGARVREMSHEQ